MPAHDSWDNTDVHRLLFLAPMLLGPLGVSLKWIEELGTLELPLRRSSLMDATMATPVLHLTPDDSENGPRRLDGSQPAEPIRELLTVAQSAQRLGVNPRTIRRHIKAGLIKAGRVKRTIRIWSTDLYASLKPLPTTDPDLDDFIRQSSVG